MLNLFDLNLDERERFRLRQRGPPLAGRIGGGGGGGPRAHFHRWGYRNVKRFRDISLGMMAHVIVG